MQNEDRLRALLSDLGRSTLRGVRKCPKCGTYNGTRGLSCKNKACDVVFKEAGEKKKQSMEVCKLDTGTSTQVYSVRVRDKGPDYRGFVQLPLMQSDLSVLDSDSPYLSQVAALCFVDSCQRLFNTNILKCHERDDIQTVATCQHVQSALRCCVEAQPLVINDSLLASLNVPPQMREAIWQLATETPGPLVQRVSKTIMAVKCKVTSKHPLGYLHVSFFASPKLKDTHSTCGCITYKNQVKSINLESSRNCVHYYACIAAFGSDPKLAEEFSQFVQKEKLMKSCASLVFDKGLDEEESQNPLASILSETIGNGKVEVEVLADASSFLNKDLILPDGITQELEVIEGLASVVDVERELVAGGECQNITTLHNSDTLTTADITCKVIPRQQVSAPNKRGKAKGLKRKNEIDPSGELQNRKRVTKKDPLKKNFKFPDERTDVSKVHQTFIEWLASVTERINQTMHFQFSGKPEPLVFLTPQVFFDCLMERFLAPSIGVRRRRLPNQVATITRKESPPLGTFYNYTWHISNILHAKAIFDTPLMVLNVTRSFVQNPDGTYDDFDPTPDETTLYPRKEGEAIIRPMELKTYLKIGKTSAEQTTPSLLSIDWTPNVLPISKIGELKITFEFGHTHSFS